MTDSAKRETLSSRLGFLMLSVGCAVGLGNVWRFPFVAGQYGGGFFVLLYLLFLVLLGYPVLMMELAVGRAGRANLVGSYRKLATRGKKWWTNLAKIIFVGNALLMMYYTTVSGWLLSYAKYYLTGQIAKCETPQAVENFFATHIGSPGLSVFYTILIVAVGTLLCCSGLRRGVETSAKYMMAVLFVLMFIMVIKALSMPGAGEGLKFYLVPSWERFSGKIVETIFAAMGQAFFTLSLGVGSMEIFGSYLGWKHSLPKESVNIICLDTLVAFMAGLIIFPVCASYNVGVNSGPGLIFVSLPNVFNQMSHGHLWGLMFFVFLSLAALTTVVAVFENIIAFLMDELKMKRWLAALTTGVGLAVLSMPCTLGFNLWKDIQPLGKGTCILDLEDFLVSQNLLPLGALAMVFFCSVAAGWGPKNFFAEVEENHSWHFHPAFRWYCKWILPLIIIAIFIGGYVQFFS